MEERAKYAVIPLRRRALWDLPIMLFFLVNLLFITYCVDLEQLVVPPSPDRHAFKYPLWPPVKIVDLVHWYGKKFDPPLLARPPWWRVTIWIDVLFFGPFYAFALYAFYKGKEWIRIPSIMYSTALLVNVSVIMAEEWLGANQTPRLLEVALFNLAWVLLPLFILARMILCKHPFMKVAKDERVKEDEQVPKAPSTMVQEPELTTRGPYDLRGPKSKMPAEFYEMPQPAEELVTRKTEATPEKKLRGNKAMSPPPAASFSDTPLRRSTRPRRAPLQEDIGKD